MRNCFALCFGVLALLAAGCGSTAPFVWAETLPPPDRAHDLLIQPRDTLLVTVGNQKEISGEFVVRDDGSYMQPPVGIVRAAGRSPAELTGELKQRLQNMIVNPDVTVTIPKRAPIKVHVIGEVKTPASYELERDRSLTAALAAAGWLNEFASSDRIYVVRARENPSRIRFRASDLKGATPSSLFQLRDGDMIVVE
jgi:polysaccharide biosynthesis/export protein